MLSLINRCGLGRCGPDLALTFWLVSYKLLLHDKFYFVICNQYVIIVHLLSMNSGLCVGLDHLFEPGPLGAGSAWS